MKRVQKQQKRVVLIKSSHISDSRSSRVSDRSARIYTKEVQLWMLMSFSGNAYADELSGCTNPLLPVQS